MIKLEFDSFNEIKWNIIDKKLNSANFITTTSKRKKVKYLDLSISFDTETTSTYTTNEPREKFAYMYVWQFGIDGYYCYGRTWSEFLQLCKHLQKTLGLNERRRLIIFIHNLSFEFQFFRKYF